MMKVTTLPIVCGLLTGVLGLFPARAQDRFSVSDVTAFTRTLRFPAGGERLVDIRNINGSIRVTGTEGDAVNIDGRKQIRAESDGDLRAAERDITVQFRDNAPELSAIVRNREGHTCGEDWGRSERERQRYSVSIDLTVQVPRGAGLRLCTINGREIRVSGTAGDFDIDHVNGRITMDRMRGSGSADTVNGAVTVSFEEAPARPSRFTTVNGAVEVTFPDGLSSDLKMKTMNGGLYTDFDVQMVPQRGALAMERRNGMSVYRRNEFTRVRAGAGGPELTFQTLNGDVRVLRAPR